MGIKCANESHEDYKALINLLDNKVVVGMVWDDLDGKVSHIKTIDQLKEAAKTAIAKVKVPKKKAATQQEGIPGIPLSSFSHEQRSELTDNLIFLAAWDENTQSTKDIEDITFKGI